MTYVKISNPRCGCGPRRDVVFVYYVVDPSIAKVWKLCNHPRSTFPRSSLRCGTILKFVFGAAMSKLALVGAEMVCVDLVVAKLN